MLDLKDGVQLPFSEIEIQAVRAQGAGGQNVNKVATAIVLTFDITVSSLPPSWKARLLALNDHRITGEGKIVIKAQTHRSQELNKAEAIERLRILILSAARVPKRRRSTKPTRASKEKRLTSKRRRGEVKAQRNRVTD